jgi:hypothetical protein
VHILVQAVWSDTFDLAMQQDSECETPANVSCLLMPLLPLVPNKIVHKARMPMLHQPCNWDS